MLLFVEGMAHVPGPMFLCDQNDLCTYTMFLCVEGMSYLCHCV
jgi:hypothetical protein